MKLNPCVFCGEVPRMFYLIPYENEIKVGCYNNKCKHQPWTGKTFFSPDKPFSKEKAIDLWNDHMNLYSERATDDLRKDFFNHEK